LRNAIRSIVLVLFLACAGLTAAGERRVEIIAPGLRHVVIDRGEAATSESYQILVGTYDRQKEADRMLERLQSNGFRAVPTADGVRYRIVIPGLPRRAEAENLRARLIERGFPPPLDISATGQDLTHVDGPWKIHVLEADPETVEVRAAHAYDAAIGLETTADLALRRGAVAAVNGGYFLMEGLLAGDARGTLQVDGRLLSEPDRGRASVGFFTQDGATRSVFGRLAFQGWIQPANGDPIFLHGINRTRGPSEIVLFTPDFHRTTLTPPGGAEIVISYSRIAAIREGLGSSLIPSGGMVLSIGAERAAQILPRLRVGDTVYVQTRIVPLLSDTEDDWNKARHIVGGGPLLLWNRTRLEEPEVESISRVFSLARHPRSAAGVRADGTLLFVTVDGRRPEESVGMSLPELTDLMLELGAVSAINLDGGGSTTMVIDGKVVNHPSGSSARRNADAILIYPRKP
jgi:exopolysaccharide biosynthesis protein